VRLGDSCDEGRGEDVKGDPFDPKPELAFWAGLGGGICGGVWGQFNAWGCGSGWYCVILYLGF